MSSSHLGRFPVEVNCGPRGGTQGAEPSSGVQRFWGPLGTSEFDPSFQQFSLGNPLPRAPWEKKVGYKEAPKRSRFSGCPLRGFQPSGSYPRATENDVVWVIPWKEKAYTTMAPVLSRSVAQPRGHRANKAMVYAISLGKQRKRVYTIGLGSVHTIEASDPEKKGFHGGVYLFFFPDYSSIRRLQQHPAWARTGN